MTSPSCTIFALSSGVGTAGVAIIRLSGAAAHRAAEALAGKPLSADRRLTRAILKDPHTGQRLDDALVVLFPAPHSFTGEAVAELHIHGGRATIAAVLHTLGQFPALRPAEPGEFTRRAFEAGKLDMTQVEGLADLIHAQTERQRRQALGQLGGAASLHLTQWRQQLLQILAHVEADVDFAEGEDDLPAGLSGQAGQAAQRLHEDMRAALTALDRAEQIRTGLTVALAGPPNAGKSSLLNALSRRDVAIVSPIAGTTRDSIEVPLDLGGIAVTLVDTAGLRPTLDPIEAEGVRRARTHIAQADLTLWLQAANESATPPPDTAPLWHIATKVDLATPPTHADHALCAPSGDGIPALLEALHHWASAALDGQDHPIALRQRHKSTLETLLGHLHSAQQETDTVLIAENIRLATRAIGRITGRVDVEEVLDLIFTEFCIGK